MEIKVDGNGGRPAVAKTGAGSAGPAIGWASKMMEPDKSEANERIGRAIKYANWFMHPNGEMSGKGMLAEMLKDPEMTKHVVSSIASCVGNCKSEGHEERLARAVEFLGDGQMGMLGIALLLKYRSSADIATRTGAMNILHEMKQD